MALFSSVLESKRAVADVAGCLRLGLEVRGQGWHGHRNSHGRYVIHDNLGARSFTDPKKAARRAMQLEEG